MKPGELRPVLALQQREVTVREAANRFGDELGCTLSLALAEVGMGEEEQDTFEKRSRLAVGGKQGHTLRQLLAGPLELFDRASEFALDEVAASSLDA